MSRERPGAITFLHVRQNDVWQLRRPPEDWEVRISTKWRAQQLVQVCISTLKYPRVEFRKKLSMPIAHAIVMIQSHDNSRSAVVVLWYAFAFGSN